MKIWEGEKLLDGSCDHIISSKGGRVSPHLPDTLWQSQVTLLRPLGLNPARGPTSAFLRLVAPLEGLQKQKNKAEDFLASEVFWPGLQPLLASHCSSDPFPATPGRSGSAVVSWSGLDVKNREMQPLFTRQARPTLWTDLPLTDAIRTGKTLHLTLNAERPLTLQGLLCKIWNILERPKITW